MKLNMASKVRYKHYWDDVLVITIRACFHEDFSSYSFLIRTQIGWSYFHCNTAVFSFDLICNTPIFLVIVILTILEVKRSKKVIRGQIMVMRGHMVKNSKDRLSHMISLGAQLSFDIHHAFVPNC